MYCSNCGNHFSEELNYCNRCGAKTGKDEVKPAGRSSNPLPYLLGALCVIDVVALFIFAALMMMFLDRHVEDKIIATVSTFYLAAFAIVNVFFLRLISRLVTLHLREEKHAMKEQKASPKILPSVTTAQLNEPWQQPIGSVIDHTTRTLDEVLVKEK